MMGPCGFTSCKKKYIYIYIYVCIYIYLLHKRDNLQKVWEHEHEGIPEPKLRQICNPDLQHVLQDTNSRAKDPGPPCTVSAPPQPVSYNTVSYSSGRLGRTCQSPASSREILATRLDHESSWKIWSLSLEGFLDSPWNWIPHGKIVFWGRFNSCTLS